MKKIKIKFLLIGIFVFLFISILVIVSLKKGKNIIQNNNLKCQIAGCSHQLCVSSDEKNIITTCEWQDKYACYQKAKCEIQKNGECGFIQDEELLDCLDQLTPKLEFK